MSRVPGDDYSAGWGDENYDLDYGINSYGGSGWAGSGDGSGMPYYEGMPGNWDYSMPSDTTPTDNLDLAMDGGNEKWSDNKMEQSLRRFLGPMLQEWGAGNFPQTMGINEFFDSQGGLTKYQDYMNQYGTDQLDYYERFMNANPAWEQNAKYGESQLLERLGQYGGSATGGFSGQQAAGLGRYWSDQTADRWSQATPYAQSQWAADNMYASQDYLNYYGRGLQDYGNYMENTLRPYNTALSLMPSANATFDQTPGQNMGETSFMSDLLSLGGMGIGAYYGGPLGAMFGSGAGDLLGSIF